MARILLIDDDDSLRPALVLLLAHSGHTVIQARNGQEGLKAFRPADVDLVITDIVMPEKEGLEVVMQVRKEQPGVKIIAISGGGRQGPTDYLHLATLLGAAKVLAKPFTNEKLLAAVNALVPGAGTPPPQHPADDPSARFRIEIVR